jgi:tRNA nucleotidyltransferase/poly(A) polymerase
MNRLRFSNEQMERVEALIANHMKFKDAGKMRESTLKRFLRQPHFEEHLELHRLDVLSSNGQLDNYELVKQRLQALPAEELKPPALLRGDDLIAAGYQPGPEFGEMLAAAEDAQLDGTVRTREEALELIRGRFGPPPTAPRP